MSKKETEEAAAKLLTLDEIKVEDEYIFDPVAYQLGINFRLTRFTERLKAPIKGPMPDNFVAKFTQLLQENNLERENDNGRFASLLPSAFTIGVECSIVPLRQGSLCLVQTTDFSYPLVDDPIESGKIACCRVLSDLYALGICQCDSLQMLMGLSTKMTEQERSIVVPLLTRGFKEKAAEAGIEVSVGQTMQNPCCLIGGTASSICQINEYIVQENAIAGDVIVLTKALGTYVACHLHQSMETPERWNRIKHLIAEEDVQRAFERAVASMSRLNLIGARLMHKYNAHCSTDVTGYGLLGHAQMMAARQKRDVSFVIHNLPIIAKMAATSKACGNLFHLLQGQAPEYSGGLLICFPREQAAAYCKDIEKIEGCQAWIIGLVERGNRTARIIEKPRVIEVPPPYKF